MVERFGQKKSEAVMPTKAKRKMSQRSIALKTNGFAV